MTENVIIAIVGLFSVLISQLVAESLKKFFTRTKEQSDIHASFREELRKEIQRYSDEARRLREELRELEAEYDALRVKYFDLYCLYADLNARHTMILGTSMTNEDTEKPD